MYEPVHLLYKIVNNSNEVDTFCQEFIDHLDFIDYEITDIQRKKTYDKRNYEFSSLIISQPFYFLQPQDTMIISMILNTQYGERLPQQGTLFSSYCYFLPGEYKVFAKIKFCRSKNKYITNETEFEVLEQSNEDKEIIERVRAKKFTEAINKYSSNPLIEAVVIEELSDYFPNYEKNYPLTREEIFLKYDDFFSHFPNSYYCYNTSRIVSLFFRLAYANSDIIQDIEYFEQKYPGSSLVKFLNQLAVKFAVIRHITDLRDRLHK